MAERTPPTFLQAGSHNAENTRLAIAQPILSGGIVDPGHMAVTAPGGTQTVSVAAGQGWVLGSRANQGAYHVTNDAAVVKTVAASDPTNARYDRLVCRIQDAAYSGAVNSFDIFFVVGTPSASPAEPAIPADSFELARVLVPAASTTVAAGNILDRRVRYVRRGAVYSAAAVGDPTLVAKVIAGQTANLQEWQNSSGTALATVSASGIGFFAGGLRASDFSQLTPSAANVVALVVKGFAAQVSNLQEWQNSSGTVLAGVISTGQIYANKGLVSGDYSQMSSSAANVVALAVRGFAAQTSDLQQWQNSAGSILFAIPADGSILTNGPTSATASAGGGNATPATVIGYLNVSVAGTARRIAYYAV